jgi:hypothetical protein
MYSSFTDLKITPKDINRNSDAIVIINITRPYMEDLNFTYPLTKGLPTLFLTAMLSNQLIMVLFVHLLNANLRAKYEKQEIFLIYL